MQDEIITISIDCYQCGTNLQFLFRLLANHTKYSYCQSCQEGVQIYLNGDVLEITRLNQE